MFVNVPLVGVMQVPVVQIIGMIVVLRSGMPAVGAVSVFVWVVRCMCRHGWASESAIRYQITIPVCNYYRSKTARCPDPRHADPKHAYVYRAAFLDVVCSVLSAAESGVCCLLHSSAFVFSPIAFEAIRAIPEIAVFRGPQLMAEL